MLAPSFAIVLIFVYGFILFTIYLSFTDSQDPAELRLGRAAANYQKLFGLPAWSTAVDEPR